MAGEGGDGAAGDKTDGVASAAAWATIMLALQAGKVKAECAEDAGLRVVMLGMGLHRAVLFVKSLQHRIQVVSAPRSQHLPSPVSMQASCTGHACSVTNIQASCPEHNFAIIQV